MKILTIAIPVYNTEKYIKRCLDSILLNDVLNDIEVITVNDGSKDNSIELLREYEKKYPETIVVIDKENGGHGSTINAALKIATGKYFKVLDSDDWLDSYNFIDFVNILKDCDEDVIASPHTEEYTYIGDSKLVDYSSMPINTTIKFGEIKEPTVEKFYIPMASSTYKLDVLKKCGLSLYENTFYVDMQYNIMPIPYIKTLRYLDKPLYRYFIGRPTQSMSQENLTRNYLHHKKVVTFVVKYYTDNEKKVSDVQREYMKFISSCMISTFFNIVCVQIKDKKLSYKTFKEFDKFLMETNKELYEYTNMYQDIRNSRKMKFLNVRYSMRFYIFAMKIIRKLRRN